MRKKAADDRNDDDADRGERPFDWAKFTNFKSRKTRQDLESLCSRLGDSEARDVFETYDRVGLCPIHWAAIHNRSDLIEFMVSKGASVRRPCRNRLFSNGTPLHLASMNGALEAASTILTSGDGGNGQQQQPQDAVKYLLNLRDTEGQTALMRSAAPRSRRMNTVRDLLLKNLWSLNGRPSEMALLLISYGSDWRLTDNSGMNLMHLAIVNDYDDIVNLLLVIDRGLLTCPVRLIDENNNEPQPSAFKKLEVPNTDTGGSSSPLGSVDTSSFKTISLTTDQSTTTISDRTLSSASSSSSSSSSSPSPSPSPAINVSENEASKPLIDKRQRAEANVSAHRSLEPLQLAILYGRVGIISLLWHAKDDQQQQQQQQDSRTDAATTNGTNDESLPAAKNDGLQRQRQVRRHHSRSSKALKQILLKACWNNKDELAKLMKVGLLKVALCLDLCLLALIWAPPLVTAPQSSLGGLAGGLFILSWFVTIALAFRVMLKNPGYLRRDSIQYLNELSQLLPASKQQRKEENDTKPKRVSDETVATEEQQQQQANSRPATPPQRSPPFVDGSELARPNWQAQFGQLADKVRLFCHKCRCIRRPRSKHCNYCNHCIQDFDHHCIYLGCCIGRNNRLDFLLTLVALAISGLYGTILHSTSDTHMSRSRSGSKFMHTLGLVWILKYALIGLLTAFFNLRRACLGVTMFEEIRSRRIRQIFGSRGPADSIARSHKAYSTQLKGSYYRYSPDRHLTGDLTPSRLLKNLAEFANSTTLDEYFLTLVCNDTSLSRSLAASDHRLNLYKFV